MWLMVCNDRISYIDFSLKKTQILKNRHWKAKIILNKILNKNLVDSSTSVEVIEEDNLTHSREKGDLWVKVEDLVPIYMNI